MKKQKKSQNLNTYYLNLLSLYIEYYKNNWIYKSLLSFKLKNN
jgi:hypothetical protein